MHIKNYSANPLDIPYKEISSNYAQEWALPYITIVQTQIQGLEDQIQELPQR